MKNNLEGADVSCRSKKLYLDVMKFNIVPDYIMKKVDEIMSEL